MFPDHSIENFLFAQALALKLSATFALHPFDNFDPYKIAKNHMQSTHWAEKVSVNMSIDDPALWRVFFYRDVLREIDNVVDAFVYHGTVDIANVTKNDMTSCDAIIGFIKSETLKNLKARI